MGYFRRSVPPPDAEAPQPSVRSLWSDSFGRLATRSLQVIIVVGLTAAIIFGLRQLTIVLIPLLIALIIASAFHPMMHWMRSHRVPSLLATIITMLTAFAVLGLVGWGIVWAVRDQWDELAQRATEGWAQLLAWFNELPFELFTEEQVAEWSETAIDFVTSAQFGQGAIAGISAVASFITGFILLLVVLFFFLKDGPRIWEFLLRPFEGESYARARRIGDKTVVTLGSYVRGTAAVALVDAIGIGIGLWILQVPLALPLAVLVFLLAFIPIVGATLAGFLAALVALVSNDLINALLVVAVVVGVNQLEGNFLQPVLMGRTLKLHAFVILIALTVGTVLAGIIGAVLAVPIAAVVWGIILVWDGADTPARWARQKRPE